MTTLESIESLNFYWKHRQSYSDENDESLLDSKIEAFLTDLDADIGTGELFPLDNSWWDNNSTLYGAYKFIEDTNVWLILISRVPSFITSMLENDARTTDHPAVITASLKNGFRYVPNCLLSGCPPGDDIHTSWRSALFSEV